MRALFGIGNPGSRYLKNRHNAGFLFLDYYAEKNSLKFIPSKGDYLFADGLIGGSKILLIKPVTYVNRSGIAVSQIITGYNLEASNLLVICDDTNLDIGTIRLRLSGGDGGHNGLASIIYTLNTNNFPRLRIGVGKSLEQNALADYVLADFGNDELIELKKVFDKAVLLADEFLTNGSKAMLDLNSKLNKSEKEENEK